MDVNTTFDNPLSDHPKYATVKYLSEGSFGFVILAKEKATGKQVTPDLLISGHDRKLSGCNVTRHLSVCR